MPQNLETEKLKLEIERLKKELKKKKKYGLVWDSEREPEEVVEMCKEKLPVLKEVKGKEIITDKNKPVNLLIEGDNYHALSVLNYTHKGKIDVIYIDPPYNTGNRDFKYNDRWIDVEDGFRHSKWLNFMEKRLNLAKDLLKSSGAIFISIDENEVAQLKLLCDKIFDEKNFESIISWRRRSNQPNDKAKMIAKVSEFILVYAKNSASLKENKFFNTLSLSEKRIQAYSNPDNDPRGAWSTTPWCASRGQGGTKYEIITPTKKRYNETWLGMRETFNKLLEDKRIVFPRNGNGKPRKKVFLKEREAEGQSAINFWFGANYGDNLVASSQLNDIFGGDRVFDNPKPTNLIKTILELKTDKNDLIVDFFAGSGTTGHAVLELNKQDDGNRKFILCTNDEELDHNSDSKKHKICTGICYPRIEKAIKGYKNQKKEKVVGLGGNLKYFRTDFVDYKDATDKSKIRLTEEAIEMLCVKEGTFEEVENRVGFKIFKNLERHTGIIFDQQTIKEFKKSISNIKGKFSVYIFSLGDDSFDDEFEDMKSKVKLSPIPEAILKVYRKIFK